MLDQILLAYARYHYSVCKYMATLTSSPYWFTARSLAGLDVSEIEGRILRNKLNGQT